MYFRRKTSAGRAYLQIVESRREANQVRQQVIATLGRFEDLQASGQLERLVRSGARFAAKAMMLSAAADDAIKIDSRTGCHPASPARPTHASIPRHVPRWLNDSYQASELQRFDCMTGLVQLVSPTGFSLRARPVDGLLRLGLRRQLPAPW
jgi:hypothetical protein